MMTEYEEIMNSGKIYKVMGLTNEDTHYHEYLQMMEKYNSLGYTEEGEKEKQRILKNCLPKQVRTRISRRPIMPCGAAGMSISGRMYM